MRDSGIEGFRNLGIVNYKSFEELPCWQNARELGRAVFEIINQGKFRKDFSLRDQI